MHSFVIPLFILISLSITRLTLRTRYTCMSFGCHFPPFASCLAFVHELTSGESGSFAMTRDGPSRAVTVRQHLAQA